MSVELFNMNCKELLARIESKSIDLIIQDAPFGVTQNGWDVKPDLDEMWPEWLRVAKENTAIIFFATQPFASELVLSQPKYFRYDLIWYKPLGTGFLNANKMPMRNHEHLIVFYKKLPTFNPQKGVGVRKKGVRKHDRNGTNYGRFATEGQSLYFDDYGIRNPQSVIEFTNGDHTSENEHPTQKPLELIRYLILTYSNPGDIVFDGYFGSGTAAIACEAEGRNFIGSELRDDYYQIACNRLKKFQLQKTLF